ncbi:MAG: bifunctional molybdenum cofactor biosynthesis protein MoaC/MoaB [Bdellovibrionales bacterium]|nr:bifunctional molybdenum cofactor biosynthesis protein MoaC/MoaB [Bdellovibrionales bacterium]
MNQNYRMIDVGGKEVTRRKAVATGIIQLCPTTMEMIRKGDSPKGNILSIAEVAGIMAAKNTSTLLPLCHPLLLDSVRVWFEVSKTEVRAFCEVNCSGKTGVEMEALVGVNVCLLTIYDLAKAVDPVVEIQDIYLLRKEGGKSGVWIHPKTASSPASEDVKTERVSNFAGLKIAVGTLSDRASRGEYEDRSGKIIREYVESRLGEEVLYEVIPDEESRLRAIISKALEKKADVLLLTGGTGLSSRDITPDVLDQLADKTLTGFGELQRHYGSGFTKASWLSRASAYVVSSMLVVIFPGSPKAVTQGLECLGELIPHAVRMIRGEAHH